MTDIYTSSALLESLFFGLYLVLFSSYAVFLIRRHERKTLFRNPMVAGALSLFMCITAHWILTTYDLFQAFVVFKDGTHALEYFDNTSGVSRVARVFFLTLIILIADILLAYRLWVIWGFNTSVIVFPCLTMVGFAVGAVGGIVVPLQNGDSSEDILLAKGKPWITAEIVGIALTNLYCTSLIGSRIWSTNQQNKAMAMHTSGSTKLTDILEIFLQSAFLYGIWGVLFITTFAFGKTIASVFANTYPTVAGIAFALISFRVSIDSVQRSSPSASPSSRVRFRTVPSNGDPESGLYDVPHT